MSAINELYVSIYNHNSMTKLSRIANNILLKA